MRLGLGIAAVALSGAAACASATQQATPRPSDEISMPSWAESGPSPSDFLRVYPQRALDAGINSVVRLSCEIRTDRKLDCEPQWEEYPGYDFGPAAVQVSRLFVMKATDDPRLQPGKHVVVPIRFVAQ